MKIALCHLKLSCGPQEKNLRLLERAVRLAGELGASWVLTPETAVQGYYFKRINDKAPLLEQSAPELRELRALCSLHKLHLFLGCAEFDAASGKNYNSCLVLAPDGSVCGSQHKNFRAGSAEYWAEEDDRLLPITCDGIRAGVLVCADSWFEKNPLALKEQGAQILLDIAAWPPTKECGDPLPSWLEVSRKTGLPFIICNQTGSTRWMDMNCGQSAAIEAGELRAAYSGEQAVLLLEYEPLTHKILSRDFSVHAIF